MHHGPRSSHGQFMFLPFQSPMLSGGAREQYLTAATYVSSRAFPSTLLSPTPSLQPNMSSHPILLPGIDALNHARAHPVSWVVTYPPDIPPTATRAEPAISLVLHNSAAAGQELFNNYGAKPNAELILGYGFALPQNPDDTIVLKIGGGGTSAGLEVGRGARGAEAVWTEVLGVVEGVEGAQEALQARLDVAEMLAGMIGDLIRRLPPPVVGDERLLYRPEVLLMFEYYLEGDSAWLGSNLAPDAFQGQRDILQGLLDFAGAQEQQAIEEARAMGMEIVFDE